MPFECVVLDQSLKSTLFEVQGKDLTILYTPVLTRENIEKVSGVQDVQPLVRDEAYGKELLRV